MFSPREKYIFSLIFFFGIDLFNFSGRKFMPLIVRQTSNESVECILNFLRNVQCVETLEFILKKIEIESVTFYPDFLKSANSYNTWKDYV